MVDNAALIYGQQQINTASPAKMVFMLYEKVIASLKEAMRAIEAGDIAARCNANCKAQEILAHLSNTLDMEQGQQIAKDLEAVFAFAMMHLIDVDAKNDPKPAQDVINLIQPLADSWRELAERSTSELASEMEQARTRPDADIPARQSGGPPQPAAPAAAQSGKVGESGALPDRPVGGISISA